MHQPKETSLGPGGTKRRHIPGISCLATLIWSLRDKDACVLLIKVVFPAVDLQPLNLLFGQPLAVSGLAIPFDVSNRTHPGNHGGNCWMAENIT